MASSERSLVTTCAICGIGEGEGDGAGDDSAATAIAAMRETISHPFLYARWSAAWFANGILTRGSVPLARPSRHGDSGGWAAPRLQWRDRAGIEPASRAQTCRRH